MACRRSVVRPSCRKKMRLPRPQSGAVRNSSPPAWPWRMSSARPYREGRRGRLQEVPDRARALPVRAHDPGLDANEQYWRKKPSVKRVVIKGIPDRTTRLAMLKTGEADIGYLMVGVEAATIKADPKLRLVHVIPSATWWLEFPEQWKPKSPWHDR